VSYETAMGLAREFHMDFMETSAKDDINVEKVFETVAEHAFARVGTSGAKLTSVAEHKRPVIMKEKPAKKKGIC
jgi:hypothetical protein